MPAVVSSKWKCDWIGVCFLKPLSATHPGLVGREICANGTPRASWASLVSHFL